MSIVINTTSDIEELVSTYKAKNKTIAFVPTMGGLHAGHLSLVDKAKDNADIVVVSIFVNPTQFGENEDFEKYPNTFENDKKLLNEKGVDVIFAPTKNEIYPQGVSSDIDPGQIANILCGASRPGHFKGVVQVVKRLFDIVEPDVAVFGEKDYQQLLVIKNMVSNYGLDINILSVPIAREKNGLAMSTRNKYLSSEEFDLASNIYKNLIQTKDNIKSGKSISKSKKGAIDFLEDMGKVDYFEILDANTLSEITDTTKKIAILCAVFIGSTRLIDNLIFDK